MAACLKYRLRGSWSTSGLSSSTRGSGCRIDMFSNWLPFSVSGVTAGYLPPPAPAPPRSVCRRVTYSDSDSPLPIRYSRVVPSTEDIASWCGSLA